jgi:hypothetical protein
MNRKTTVGSLILGAVALFPALAPAPQASDDGKLKALAEAKAAVARKIVEFYADARLAPPANRLEAQGVPVFDQVEIWSRRLLDSRLDATPVKAERVAILGEEVDRTKAIEARIKELAERESGFGKLDGFKAEFNRLDAEYRLLKEKAEK